MSKELFRIRTSWYVPQITYVDFDSDIRRGFFLLCVCRIQVIWLERRGLRRQHTQHGAISTPPAAAVTAASVPGAVQRPRALRVRRSPSHAHECPRRGHQLPPACVAKPPSADHVSPRFPDVQNRPWSGSPTHRAGLRRQLCSAYGGHTPSTQWYPAV
jgi:hypothetical protein